MRNAMPVFLGYPVTLHGEEQHLPRWTWNKKSTRLALMLKEVSPAALARFPQIIDPRTLGMLNRFGYT